MKKIKGQICKNVQGCQSEIHKRTNQNCLGMRSNIDILLIKFYSRAFYLYFTNVNWQRAFLKAIRQPCFFSQSTHKRSRNFDVSTKLIFCLFNSLFFSQQNVLPSFFILSSSNGLCYMHLSSIKILLFTSWGVFFTLWNLFALFLCPRPFEILILRGHTLITSLLSVKLNFYWPWFLLAEYFIISWIEHNR